MSINKQCKLLSVPRSSYYHKPKRKVSLEDELLMQVIDRIYMDRADLRQSPDAGRTKATGLQAGAGSCQAPDADHGDRTDLPEAAFEHSG